jgi:hypothetical protein
MATIFTPAVYVYERGGMVIYMLRTLLGDAKFFQAIKNYCADPVLKYRNAITDDVKRHMEAVSGLNLSTFFNQWIYNTGFAKYDGATWNNVAKHIILRMPQTAQSSALTHFDMPVAVRIQGSNPVTMDTTIIVYDQAGILYYDDNGALTTAAGNIVQYDLSFVPVAITFDAFNQVLASGSFTKDPALTVLATDEFTFSATKAGPGADLLFNIPDAAAYALFELERSTDALEFNKITSFKTADFPGRTGFTYTDPLPGAGLYYYRVKITMRDGTIRYSKTVSLSVKDTNAFRITPNPASGFIIIESKTAVGNLNINICDAAGKSVKKINQALQDNRLKIDVHDFKPGNYFVEIQTALREKYSHQIIVAR